MKNLFLWFKYIVVKHESTLNFGWLRQYEVAATSNGDVLGYRGTVLTFPSGTAVVLNATSTTLTIAKL
ncbi:MAG: hypothetical protein KME42_14115 [Tildeniella nuda ZEHNDER 1965/U140]|jgi:hypothetical protein|nr:hypothetical protein [Tildeniella nuda ZEHNDER 1965/U140]